MKVEEIAAMDKKASEEKLTELKKELVKLNAQVAIGAAIKNTGQIRKIKKTIARIYTVQKGQERGIENK
ncbi:MAG: 50S ribosomal protein L29, partial [Nanoarchaeota archaeon]